MNSKELHFAEEARQQLLKGVISLASAVEATLGPRGRNVIIEKNFGSPLITKDGVTVAKEIKFENSVVNMGAQMVKEVASKTCDEAGDGTTTATVLAKSIVIEGHKAIAAGMNPMDLKRGMDKAVTAVVEELKNISSPCVGMEGIAQVGTISANSDKSIGNLIATAMDKVGKEGVITIEDAQGIEDVLVVVEGMEFDRGYISPYFVTNPQSMSCELISPYILLVDKKVSSIREILPLLECAAREGRSIFIVAEDVEGEALATLAVNNSKGIVKACAVKSPGFGDSRKEILQDIAILTKAKVVSSYTGITLEDADVNCFGQAQKVIVKKDKATIIGGWGDRKDIEDRATHLRIQADASTVEYTRDQLRQRAAKISGGIGVIQVGASSEAEAKEKKARVEDALHATRAAVEEGVVPGGGIALIRTIPAVRLLNGDNNDQNHGIAIIIRALEAPLRQIVINSGVAPDVVINKIQEGKGNFGYDASTGKYGDMIKLGILDPTKVTRTALQKAASIAGLLITTECTISNIPNTHKRGNIPRINFDDQMDEGQQF